MPTPNLFLTYVSDTEISTAFYSDLFDMQPSFISPRYVAFEISKDVLFAVWTGHNTHMEKQTLGLPANRGHLVKLPSG